MPDFQAQRTGLRCVSSTLMFSTEMGDTADGSMRVYLIARKRLRRQYFVNFLNVPENRGRMRIPFGIAQNLARLSVTKSLRVSSSSVCVSSSRWKCSSSCVQAMSFEWFRKMEGDPLEMAQGSWSRRWGVSRYHDHEKLAALRQRRNRHRVPYAVWLQKREAEGIHSRTNFSTSVATAIFSGKKIQYFDPELNQSYVPYVIETSIGVDRMFLSVYASSYEEEKLENGETRVVLHLPAAWLGEGRYHAFGAQGRTSRKGSGNHRLLKFDFKVQYDGKDSIGKRYRRQDAIGTPYCITVDHQTLEDNTVTIRHRDTMEQSRVAIADIAGILDKEVTMKSLLKKLL